MLGCGILHREVMQMANINTDEKIGWASGIGIERLAMLLFDIPDVRLFWSEDNRFIN